MDDYNISLYEKWHVINLSYSLLNGSLEQESLKNKHDNSFKPERIEQFSSTIDVDMNLFKKIYVYKSGNILRFSYEKRAYNLLMSINHVKYKNGYIQTPEDFNNNFCIKFYSSYLFTMFIDTNVSQWIFDVIKYFQKHDACCINEFSQNISDGSQYSRHDKSCHISSEYNFFPTFKSTKPINTPKERYFYCNVEIPIKIKIKTYESIWSLFSEERLIYLTKCQYNCVRHSCHFNIRKIKSITHPLTQLLKKVAFRYSNIDVTRFLNKYSIDISSTGSNINMYSFFSRYYCISRMLTADFDSIECTNILLTQYKRGDPLDKSFELILVCLHVSGLIPDMINHIFKFLVMHHLLNDSGVYSYSSSTTNPYPFSPTWMT